MWTDLLLWILIIVVILLWAWYYCGHRRRHCNRSRRRRRCKKERVGCETIYAPAPCEFNGAESTTTTYGATY